MRFNVMYEGVEFDVVGTWCDGERGERDGYIDYIEAVFHADDDVYPFLDEAILEKIISEAENVNKGV